MSEPFTIGMSATQTFEVRPELTVGAHGTVDLPVLATPQLIFMLEDTCVLCALPGLSDDELTVGTSVHVDHLAASKIGERIETFAELVSIRGRRLVFRVEAKSGKVAVARGLHERATIQKSRFVAALG